MKFYLISDNVDTEMGLRLVGIEGEVVHKRRWFSWSFGNKNER